MRHGNAGIHPHARDCRVSSRAVERQERRPRDARTLGEQVTQTIRIAKADDDTQNVFGVAMCASKADGSAVVDHHDHWITETDLEAAAYDFVMNAAPGGPISGEQHDPDYVPDGRLIESVVLTTEKCEAMGIDPASVDKAWWIGVHIEDRDAYERVKNGERPMLSIEGTAVVLDEVPA